MEILGYALSFIIGISLGLLGGGGAIVAVPVLVYIFGIETVLAQAYSLFIVGVSGLFGAAGHVRQKNVSFRYALLFGIPSLVMILLVRNFLLPLIPLSFEVGGIMFTRKFLLLQFLAVLMLLSGINMLTAKKDAHENSPARPLYFLVLAGLTEGLISGMAGAGGGFIIVFMLVSLVRIPVKKAIGTSLVIVSFKSLAGFLFDPQLPVVDWKFLSLFSALAVAGILVGVYLNKKTHPHLLKKYFGGFLVAMALFIMIKELVNFLQV